MVFVFKNMGISFSILLFLFFTFFQSFLCADNVPFDETKKAHEEVGRKIHAEKVSLNKTFKEIEKLRTQYEQLLKEYEEHNKIYDDSAHISQLREKDLDIYLYNLEKIEKTLREHEILIEGSLPLFYTLNHFAETLSLQLYSPEHFLSGQKPEKELCALFYYQKIEQLMEELSSIVKIHVTHRNDLLQQKENILAWKRASINTRQSKDEQKEAAAKKLQTLEELRAEIHQKLNERMRYTEQLEVLITDMTMQQRDLLFQLEAEFEDGIIRKGLLPWPTKGDLIESFEYDPQNANDPQNNPGINIAALYGQDVISVANGVVVYSDWFHGYGNLVIIDHGEGILTLYAHLSDTTFRNGTTVKQGDVIGLAGNTASLKGPMLHFAVRVHSSPQDPREWLLPTR